MFPYHCTDPSAQMQNLKETNSEISNVAWLIAQDSLIAGTARYVIHKKLDTISK